jgi:SAM-dependent methyltransferase
MDQHTGGIHGLLSAPWAYRAYQRAIGARKLHRAVIARLEPGPGSRLLDIGCGPAELLDTLSGVEYVGFDLSSRYIEHARRRYGPRGSFFVASVSEVDPTELGKYDLVLAHGLFHHVSDEVAGRVAALARDVLEPSGRFVTVDGCFDDAQSRIARYLVSKDRGQMIRTAGEYRRLVEPAFSRVDVHVDHSLLRIPYTLATLICEGPRARSSHETSTHASPHSSPFASPSR